MSVHVTVLWAEDWRVEEGQLEVGRLVVGSREYNLVGPAATRLYELFRVPPDVSLASRLVVARRAGGLAWVSAASTLMAYEPRSARRARTIRVGGVSGRMMEGVPYSADVVVRVLTPFGACVETSTRQVSPVWVPLEDARVAGDGWLAELLGAGFRGLAVRDRYAVWVGRGRVWLATVAERSVPVEVLYRRIGRLGVVTGITRAEAGGAVVADLYAGDLVGTFILSADRVLVASQDALGRWYGPSHAVLDVLLRAVAATAVHGRRPRLALLLTLFGLASTLPRATAIEPVQPEKALHALASSGRAPYSRDELERIKAAYTVLSRIARPGGNLLLAVRAGGSCATFRLRGDAFELDDCGVRVPASGILIVRDNAQGELEAPWWLAVDDVPRGLDPELEQAWLAEAIKQVSAPEEGNNILEWAYERFSSNGLATLIALVDAPALEPAEYTRALAGLLALRHILRAGGGPLPDTVRDALALAAEKLRAGGALISRPRKVGGAEVYVLDEKTLLVTSTSPRALEDAVHIILQRRAAHVAVSLRGPGKIEVSMLRDAPVPKYIHVRDTGEPETWELEDLEKRRSLYKLAKLKVELE